MRVIRHWDHEEDGTERRRKREENKTLFRLHSMLDLLSTHTLSITYHDPWFVNVLGITGCPV